jgi:DNA-binding CsgD family transcriptional regulator
MPEAVTAVARLANSPEATVVGHITWESALEGERGANEPPTEPAVQHVLSLLAPHFAAARQVRKRLAEALRGRLALASLDRLAVAAFMLNRNGTVQHCNAWARKLLHEERCCRLKEERLRFDDPALNAAFDAALARATQLRPRSSLLPLTCPHREVYEITVLPLEPEEGAAASRSVTRALVTIARPRADARRIAERMRRLYGLTDAEARVVAALALGGSVDEVAAAHGVRASTVRAQVRSIFDKTGVNRQTDLVRLALAGAPLVDSPER